MCMLCFDYVKCYLTSYSFEGDIKESMSTKWRISCLFLVTCDLSAMLIGNVVIEIEHVSINAPV